MKYQMSSSSNKIMLVQRDHPEYDYKSVTVYQIKNSSSDSEDENWSEPLSVENGDKHCHKENGVTEKKCDKKNKKQLWRKNKFKNTFFFTNLQSKKVLTVLPNGSFITFCQSQFVSNKSVIQ